MRSNSLATAVVSALFLTAGCSTQDRGQPKAASVPEPQPPTQVSQTDRPSRELFDDVDACGLLDRAVEGQGFPPGKFSDIGSDNGCRAEKTGRVIQLSLDDEQSLDDWQNDPAKTFRGTVNGLPAVKVKDSLGDGGTCEVGFELGPDARTIVTVALGSNGPTDEACGHATKVAEAVEPDLPKG